MGGAVKEKGGKLWENGERCGGVGWEPTPDVTPRWVTQRGRRFHPPPRFRTRHVTQVTTQKAFFFFFSSYILFFMEDSSSGVIALVRTTSPQILQKNKTVETDLLCPQNKRKENDTKINKSR